MNKQERKLKGIYKFKKRLSNHHLSASIMSVNSKSNLHAFKTTGKPCSCVMCSPAKTGEIRSTDNKRIDTIKNKIDDYFNSKDCDIIPQLESLGYEFEDILMYDDDMIH